MRWSVAILLVTTSVAWAAEKEEASPTTSPSAVSRSAPTAKTTSSRPNANTVVPVQAQMPEEPVKDEGESLFTSLDYPELQVVPRASERLQLEAQLESNSGWMTFWPFHLSAIATLYTGYALSGDYYSSTISNSDKKRFDFMTQAATGVGVTWLAINSYYALSRPYTNEYRKIRSIASGKDRRSELLRERLSEEALERPARMVRILTWASFITNFAANALLYDWSTPSNNIYPIAGALASTLPFIFNHRYITNYEKHLEYKRKIYAPIAYVDFMKASEKAPLEPRMVVQWSF